jgi:hypothetical protein
MDPEDHRAIETTRPLEANLEELRAWIGPLPPGLTG